MTQIRVVPRRTPQPRRTMQPSKPQTNIHTPAGQMNVKAMQKFTSEQPYVVGEDYPIVVGDNEAKVNLGGIQGMLLGINFYNTADETKITLTINNEIVIRTANARFFNPSVNQSTKNEQYFQLTRPLNGSDDVQIKINGTNAGRLFASYYIQSR